MGSVSTTLIGTQVQISWLPLNSMGNAIQKYKIEIKTSSNTYEETLTNCDGTDSNIISNNYCLIPMSVFLASPYSLSQGALIVARVQSYNAIGWSALSTDNTQGV